MKRRRTEGPGLFALAALAALAAFALLAAIGCEETVKILDVDLQVKLAQGVAEDLDLALDDLDLNASYVTDTGEANGGAPGDDVAFPTDATSASFALLGLFDGSIVGRGATGQIDLPDLDGSTVVVPLLLAGLEVGAINNLPPPLQNPCIAADEAGSLFVVGGSANQAGYEFTSEFAVTGLRADTFGFVEALGCSAHAGVVVFAGGCDGDGSVVRDLFESNAETTGSIPLAPPAQCGTFAAKSKDQYWVLGPSEIILYSNAGVLLERADRNLAIVDVESLDDGRVLVKDGPTTALLISPGNLNAPESFQNVQAIGRRFNNVAFLTVDGRLFLEAGGAFAEARNNVDVGAAISFTVLSDSTVVAIVGNELVVSTADEVTRSVLPTPRTHVSALPGDTVLLVGGAAGLDGVSLR